MYPCGKTGCEPLVIHVEKMDPKISQEFLRNLIHKYKRKPGDDKYIQPLRLINYCTGCPGKRKVGQT